MLKRVVLSIALLLVLGLSLSALAQETDAPMETARFTFREPGQRHYRVKMPPATAKKENAPVLWLEATQEGSTNTVLLGNRITLQIKAGANIDAIISGRPLRLSRRLNDTTFIVEAPDAQTAFQEAQSLSQSPDIVTSYPIARRPKQLLGAYARKPNDPYFFRANRPNTDWQPNLENRDTNGIPIGVDLNVRSAWPITRGRGIVLAVGDDGVDLLHPDLESRVAGAPHLNFYSRETNGSPSGLISNHGTAVAGLAGASGDNGIGISGVAPEVTLASWVLFNARDGLDLSDEDLMDMYQYQSNIVSVQNHSWGKSSAGLYPLSVLEDIAISNTVTFGRNGRGIVMVRASGNGRNQSHNANDDGYTADPRAIAVGAVRLDGRVTGYSTPGASILVAAPSGDADDEESNPCVPISPNLFTTDRRGERGYNGRSYTNDLANYAFGEEGFSGTSASAPQVSGVVSLILSANTNLTYRDVQQVLLLSSRHYHLDDPDLSTNGAGLRVSHNLGFGVPDAGGAVRLAQGWTNRSPIRSVTRRYSERFEVPSAGLRLEVSGTNVPEPLKSIETTPPAGGAFADQPTDFLPMVNIGQASDPVTQPLTGKAALIQRGGNFFCEKLANASVAGANFAVVYNNPGNADGANGRIGMRALEFSPIPSAFINQTDGEALRDFLETNPELRVRLKLHSTNIAFQVTEPLLCEHVLVKIDSNHGARGDLRIVLVSPAGTRSVLQHLNGDGTPGPQDWTYSSTHHFFESSVGTWTIEFSDLGPGGTGEIENVELTVLGTSILDQDADGLDDNWEQKHLSSLSSKANDDPDGDGLNNAREQIMGTNPRTNNHSLELNLSVWDSRLARLSWSSSTNTIYQIRVGQEALRAVLPVTNLVGRFPETEWFVPYTNIIQFFQIETQPVTRN